MRADVGEREDHFAALVARLHHREVLVVDVRIGGPAGLRVRGHRPVRHGQRRRPQGGVGGGDRARDAFDEEVEVVLVDAAARSAGRGGVFGEFARVRAPEPDRIGRGLIVRARDEHAADHRVERFDARANAVHRHVEQADRVDRDERHALAVHPQHDRLCPGTVATFDRCRPVVLAAAACDVWRLIAPGVVGVAVRVARRVAAEAVLVDVGLLERERARPGPQLRHLGSAGAAGRDEGGIGGLRVGGRRDVDARGAGQKARGSLCGCGERERAEHRAHDRAGHEQTLSCSPSSSMATEDLPHLALPPRASPRPSTLC